MNKWKIEVSGASGPVLFGLQTVAAAVREHAGYEPAICERVGEGNCIRLGVDPVLPRDAYRLRVCEPEAGGQQVFLSGADECALMYACMDFVNAYLVKAGQSDTSGSPYYAYPLFGERPLPACDRTSAPRVPGRGLWTWGHAIYDVRGYLENMARLKLNEVIIWNDYLPVNAREVVEYAHRLGIRVIWGYAWGWDTGMNIDLSDPAALERAADEVVKTYERVYADAEGDGVYFQSFTETAQDYLNGRLIAEVVVEWVNGIAGRILEKHPNLLLQFGLHATSVRSHLDYIAKTDPRIQIIWEDCGDFPYHYMPSRRHEPEKTRAFTEEMLALRPDARTGAVLKGMICLNWNAFEHQSGPFVMGKASEQAIAERQAQVRRIWRQIQAEWMTWGDVCRQTVCQLSAQPVSLYGLVEDGLFERAIPLPAAVFAEILWDCDRDYGEILRQCAERPDVVLY